MNLFYNLLNKSLLKLTLFGFDESVLADQHQMYGQFFLVHNCSEALDQDSHEVWADAVRVRKSLVAACDG